MSAASAAGPHKTQTTLSPSLYCRIQTHLDSLRCWFLSRGQGSKDLVGETSKAVAEVPGGKPSLPAYLSTTSPTRLTLPTRPLGGGCRCASQSGCAALLCLLKVRLTLVELQYQDRSWPLSWQHGSDEKAACLHVTISAKHAYNIFM